MAQPKRKFAFMPWIKRVVSSVSAKKFYSSLVCALVGLIVGFFIMLALSPADAVFDFPVLITGGLQYFGFKGFCSILAKTAPLLCCGLCVIFAYKTGLFNIGAAGQYTLGSFGALVFALYFHWHWSLCILMAVLFGAIWAAIPGILKAFCHVNEVIGGIMLNWIALFFVNYSLQTYLISIVDIMQGNKTYDVSGISKLPNLGMDTSVVGNSFSIAIFIALIVAIAISIILGKTTLGYQLKASGLSKEATRYAGMNDKKNLILTMVIAGALAGLGGAFYYLAGIEQWKAADSTSLSSVPWNGIVVAFLAQINPIGAIFASLFISVISSGAMATTQTVFPKEIGDLITGIVVYLSGLTAIIINFFPKIREFFIKVFRKKKAELAVAGEGENPSVQEEDK